MEMNHETLQLMLYELTHNAQGNLQNQISQKNFPDIEDLFSTQDDIEEKSEMKII